MELTSVTHHQYQQDWIICYTTTSINRTDVISYTTTSINRTENMTSVTQPPVSTERNAWHLLHNHQYQQDWKYVICYTTTSKQDWKYVICYTTTSINRTECVTSVTQPPVSTGLKIVICYTTTSINRTENMSSVTQPPVSTERNAWHLLHNHQYQQDWKYVICYTTTVSTGELLHNHQ